MGYLYSLENHLKGFWDFYHATKVGYPKPIASFSVAKFRQKAKKKFKQKMKCDFQGF
jgi:hypothetical protein